MSLNQARVNGGSDFAPGSQIPLHLIADAHEWIDEIPTVSINHPANRSQGNWTGMISWEENLVELDSSRPLWLICAFRLQTLNGYDPVVDELLV